ncbi:hypothetical protein CONPUDRAFT_154592 [Coniophora puteana RWD-64-598 SS2]|uniref:Uncharacterized protein n=1 Tax=Coniophora puteana (strain RWD-64-598) TaxID=741705 RepID=A0A5M3MNE6_CONPW|nr:uncharacterized protein CONPUDRAFT_154592 [Coniophora puteana RWD-64-598 SS2]EIW80566.1 hypothetical protein CONPUDRAFT_154592 [Coniophora puteana RWD-64-598 SS2]
MSGQAVISSSQPVPAIHHLPFELLVKIFVLSARATIQPVNGISIHRYPSSRGVVAHPSGALNVAQVCRGWRGVALGTSELWNLIRAPSAGDASTSSDPFPLPVQVLSRSRLSSVFLILNPRRHFDSWSIAKEANLSHIQSSLVLENVKGMDLHGMGYTIPYQVIFNLAAEFPNLTHLSLVGMFFDHHVHVPTPLLNRLTHMHACTYSYQVMGIFDGRAWPSLISLTLEIPEYFLEGKALRAIFLASPNLAELFIVANAIPSPVGWINMSSANLRTFSLWMRGEHLEQEHLDSIFDALTLPSLSNLMIARPPKGNFAVLRRFIQRSKCHLSSLTLTNVTKAERKSEIGIRRAAEMIGQKLAITSVEFALTIKKTRIYRNSKERWYAISSS